MNKRRKAYLRQLVAMKAKVPGLSEDDVRYIVSHINSIEKKLRRKTKVPFGGKQMMDFLKKSYDGKPVTIQEENPSFKMCGES